MSFGTGKIYLEQLADDPVAQRALLACAAALRLDDESACEAIEIVAQANGRTRELLHTVKNLGCIWRQWDGSWYLSENVRKELLFELYQCVPTDQISKLRNQFADKADQKAAAMTADGQITAHQLRITLIEAGYQRTMVSEQATKGGEQLGAIWEKAAPAAGEATARAVDYLASEIQERIGQLPVQVLFLRGMAARARHDLPAQEKYFRAVWEKGTNGQIYGIAAHFFGNLARDKATAERALSDSLRWYPIPTHRGHVLHSLGNLLSKDRRRWSEAEDAYQKSLELQHDAPHQAQVWHSLGNLLSKDRRRWNEAEDAYQKSLELQHDAPLQAQVWHSLGNLLSKDRRRWNEAEDAYQKSLELQHDAPHQAQVWHSLGNLLSKDRRRWNEAENAFNKSIELWPNLEHQAHVDASLANLLSKKEEPETDGRAERLCLSSLKHDQGNPWTNGICYRVLAKIYERRGDFPKAIDALKSLQETNRQLGERKFQQSITDRIASLSNGE
ncbi:MAG: tetratricopeptide repeat protein [Desulfobulbaceae bacterium]|nr:tetratricopeptide repeat protein [Desulfobulbaceae bacterium]